MVAPAALQLVLGTAAVPNGNRPAAIGFELLTGGAAALTVTFVGGAGACASTHTASSSTSPMASSAAVLTERDDEDIRETLTGATSTNRRHSDEIVAWAQRVEHRREVHFDLPSHWIW